MSTVMLSVRVKRRIKEKAERLGIDIKAVVERALEEEVRRAGRERFRKIVEEYLKAMEKISMEEWIRAVRESRRER